MEEDEEEVDGPFTDPELNKEPETFGDYAKLAGRTLKDIHPASSMLGLNTEYESGKGAPNTERLPNPSFEREMPRSDIKAGSKPLDYFGMKLLGNDDSDVFEAVENRPEYEISLLDREAAYKTYEPLAKESGVDWSPEAFNGMYNQIENDYANYKRGVFDTPRDRGIYGRRWDKDQPRPSTTYNPVQKGFTFEEPWDTRWNWIKGHPVRNKTDQEFWADDVGYYQPITEEGTNRGPDGREYSPTKFHDVEIPGRGKARMGKVDEWIENKSHYAAWNPEGHVEGAETMLVTAYDDEGMPYGKEVSMYSHGVDPNSILSYHGPREFASNSVENYFSKIIDWANYLPSDFLNIVDSGSDAIDNFNGSIGLTNSRDVYRWTDKYSDYWMNYGNSWSKTTPHDVQTRGMWGSPEGFFYNFGTVSGSIVQMLTSRGAALGALKGLTNLGKMAKQGSRIRKASDNFSKVKDRGFVRKRPMTGQQKVANRVGSLTLASAASGHFKRTLEQNGVNDTDIWPMYAAAFAGSYLIERSGRNWVDDGLSQAWIREEYKGIISKQLPKFLKNLNKTSAKDLSEREASKFGSVIWKGMLKSANRLGSGSSAIAKTFARSPVMMAAVEEGREEVMEGILYRGMEGVHDMVKVQRGKYGDTSKDYWRFNYITEVGFDDTLTYYEVDSLSGIKRRVSKDQWEEDKKKSELGPGNGLTGKYDPYGGFTGNVMHRAFDSQEMINEFVLGAMAGGITIAITNPNALWTSKKQNQMKQAVLQGKGDMVSGVLGDMLDKGQFGPKDVTNDNKAIFGEPKVYDVNGKPKTYEQIIRENPSLVNDELFEAQIGSNPPLPGEMSINTLAYKAAMQDLAKAEIIVQKMGIYDSEIMNQLMSNSEGKDLLSEAYDNVIATKEKTDQIVAQEALLSEEMSEDEKAAINAKIKALKAERESLNLQLEDIRTGNRFRDDSVRMISDFVGRSNNKRWIGPDGQVAVMNPSVLKEANIEYDALRKLSIEKAQENKQLRKELDKDIDILKSIKSPNAETKEERVEGYKEILSRVDGIRNKVKNLGANEAAMNEALENLSKIRNDIIDNIPNYLTGPELEEAEKTEGYEIAPEEILGKKTEEGRYFYTSAGEAIDFAKKVEDTIDQFDEVPAKPSIMNKDGKTPSKRKYTALKNKIEGKGKVTQYGLRSKEKTEKVKKDINENLGILEEIAKHGKTFEKAFDALMERMSKENPVSRLRKEGLTDEQIDVHPDFLKWNEIDKLIDSFERFGIQADNMKTPVAEAIEEEKEKLRVLPTQKVRLKKEDSTEGETELDATEMAEWNQYMELGDPNFPPTTITPVAKPYKKRYEGFDDLEYDEGTFKQNFWMTYFDENGNSLSILDEIASLKERSVLEKEDAARINNIRDAIINQDYKLTAMKKGLQDMLIKDGEYRMGDYVPSKHATISDDDFTRITKAIREAAGSLVEVEIQYERDINSISNRNDRFRFNTSRIKRDILEIIRTSEYFVLNHELDTELIGHVLNIDKRISAVKEKYVSTSTYDNELLNEIDQGILAVESIIHKVLSNYGTDAMNNFLKGKTAENGGREGGVGQMYYTYKGYKPSYRHLPYNEEKDFTKGLDFEELYSYDTFSAKDSQNKSTAEDNAKRGFSRLFFTSYVQQLARMDSREFWIKYQTKIDSIAKDGLILSSQQKQVLQQVVSFLHNPSYEVTELLDGSLSSTKAFPEGNFKELVNFKNAINVRGFAGTGKTTMAKYMVDFYRDMSDDGSRLNVAVAAPSNKLLKSLGDKLGTTNRSSIEELTEKIISDKDFNLDLIVVDEHSTISRKDTESFRDALMNAISNSNRNPRVIFLGDESQMTDLSQEDEDTPGVSSLVEKTLPLSTVFRTGAADLANLQNAIRLSLYGDKEIIYPKGTYSKGKKSGLQYIAGGTRGLDAIYDEFIDSIESDDSVLSDDTMLIVLDNEQRHKAINYIKNKTSKLSQEKADNLVRTLDKSIDSKSGKSYTASGEELSRIYVAIDKSNIDLSEILYRKALLTAASRAVGEKNKDTEYFGFVGLYLEGEKAFSEEGVPLNITDETQTFTDEKLKIEQLYIASLLGRLKDAEFSVDTETNQREVTKEDVDKLRKEYKDKIGKGENQISFDPITHTYIYDNDEDNVATPVSKILDEVSSAKKIKDNAELNARAARGNLVHYLVNEIALQGKSMEDHADEINSFIKKFNDANAKIDDTSSRMGTIGEFVTVDDNVFISNLIESQIEPLRKYLGEHIIGEVIIGSKSHSMAGIGDIINVVGMDKDIPVVDVIDIKTTVNKDSYLDVLDGEHPKNEYGQFTSPANENLSVPHTQGTRALLQTLLYGKLIKHGENQPIVRINDHKVIPLQFARENNEPKSFSSDDVISVLDMEKDQDTDVNRRIEDLEEIAEAIWVNEEKQLEGERDYAVKKSPLVGQMFKNNDEGTIVNVTDSYKQNNRTWVEVEGNEQGIKQTEQDFVTENSVYNQPNPVNYQEVQDGGIDLGRGTVSALSFANHGRTFTWTTFTTPKAFSIVSDDKGKWESFHQEVKMNFLKQFFAQIGDTTSDPQFELKYASQVTLVDDSGNSKLFNKVLFYSVSPDHYLELGKAVKEVIEERTAKDDKNIPSLDYALSVGEFVEKNIKDDNVKEEHAEIYRQIKSKGGTTEDAVFAIVAIDNELDNMGSLPHADMFNKKGENIDYLTDSDFARSSVDERFKNDPGKSAMINWNKHLIDLREKGATMLQDQLAADENAPDVVTIGNVSAQGWKTDRLTKYKKDVFNASDKFIEDMKKKGWKFSKPYFNVAAYTTGQGTSKKTISSWAIDAHRIDPSITTPVLLWTDLYSAEYHDEMIKDLDELSDPTWDMVYESKAYKFIAANTSFLTTPDGNSITNLIPDLNKHLFKHALYVEPVQKKGGIEVPVLITNIRNALKLIKTDFDGKRALAPVLHQNAPITVRNKKLVSIAGQGMEVFKTSAVDIHQESIYLNTVSLIRSEDDAEPGTTKDVDSFNERKTNFDLRSKSYDPSKEGSAKNIKKEDHDESSFMTEEQYEALKDAQTKYFGSYRDAYKVRNFVAQELIFNSSLNRDLSKPGFSTGQMLEKTIRSIENRKNNYEIGKDAEGKLITETLTSDSLLEVEVEYSITRDQMGVLSTLGDVSGENYNLLSINDKWRYMSYVLGSPDTKALSEIVTSILPGILKGDYKGTQMDELIRQIYEDIAIEKQADLKMTESEYDEYAAEFQEGRDNIMDDLDKKNYQESIGALTNLFFNYTNLRKYNKNGTSERTTQMIDIKVAHKEIITAFAIANNPSESQMAREETRNSRIQRVEENLREAANKAGFGTPAYNNIMTVIDVFFSSKAPKKGMHHSYRFLANQSLPDVAGSNALYYISNLNADIIEQKGKASADFFSSLVVHLGSLAQRNPIWIQYNTFSETYSEMYPAAVIGGVISNQLKNAIKNTLFYVNEANLDMDEDKMDMLSRYNIRYDGIYDQDGKELIRVTYEKKSLVPVFELSPNVSQDDISALLRLSGINTHSIWPSTIKQYIQNVEDYSNSENYKVTRSSLAEIVGMLTLTAKSAEFHFNTEEDDKYRAQEIPLNQRINAYYEKNGYKKLNVNEITNETNIENNEIGLKFFKPSDLTRLIDNIAKRQSDSQMSNYSRHSWNVKNQLVYRDINASSIFKIFPYDPASDRDPSQHLEEIGKQLLEEGSITSINEGVLEDGTKVVFNSLLDPDDNHRIVAVHTTDGLREKITHKSGRIGRDLEDIDYANFMVNGLFINGVKEGKRIQDFKIPYHNTGKANVPIFTHRFSNRRIVKHTEKGGIELTDFGKEWIAKKIRRNFDYYNNARNTSIDSWIDTLVSFGYPIKEMHDEKDGWIKSNAKWERFVETRTAEMVYNFENEGLSTEEAHNAVVSRFLASNLTVESDYLIFENEKGLPIILSGKRASMRIDGEINFVNYGGLKARKKRFEAKSEILEKAKNEEWSQEKIDEALKEKYLDKHVYATDFEYIDNTMYGYRNRGAAYLLKNMGFKMQNNGGPDIEEKFYYPLMRTEIEQDEDVPTHLQRKYMYEINPALQAYLYLYNIADHSVSQLTMGDTTQYPNPGMFFKRASGPVAPYYTGDVDNPRGHGLTMKIAIVDDIRSKDYHELKNLIGHQGKTSTEVSDGFGVIWPISYILMRNMYGGEAMSMLGKGMAKPVYNNVNLHNNTNLYIKYAVLPATEGVLANSSSLREEMRKTMPADLYKKWEDGASFEELAEEVISTERQSELVAQSIFRSGVKTGAHRVNTWGTTGDYQTIEVDNEYMGIQLNASQDIEKTENTSSPVQITAVQNGVEEDSAGRFDKLNASFARTGRAKVREKITRDGVIERGLFFKHLRQLGKNASSQMAKLGKFTELVQNPNINLNLRQVRTKLVQFFINDINDNVIKPKWNGVRMSQAPQFLLDIYADKRTGRKILGSELAGQDIEGLINSGVLEKSELAHMEFYSDSEFKNRIETKEEFDKLVAKRQVHVKPGEVIMPYSYFKKFALNDWVKKDGMYYRPDFSLNNIFEYYTPTSQVSKFKEKFAEEGQGKYQVVTNFKQDDLSETKKIFSEIKRMFESDPNSISGFIVEKFGTVDEDNLVHFDEIEALEWYSNFKESLQVFINRVPASSMSAAFIGETVGWIQDAGNVIFTNEFKNLLDGGDYDIDQLQVYSRFISNSGETVRKGQKGKLNEQFDILYQYYQNAKNAELYLSPISMEHIRSLSEGKTWEELETGKEKAEWFLKNRFNDFGNNLWYYDKQITGDNLVGTFANVTKNYSYLLRAIRSNPLLKTSKLHLSLSGKNHQDKHIIDYIESFMNAALDNIKELILGPFGATIDSGWLVGAAAMDNISEEQLQNLLKNPQIQQLFRRMKWKRSVQQWGFPKLLDEIDTAIKDLEGKGEESKAELEERILKLNTEIVHFEGISKESLGEEEKSEDPSWEEEQIYSLMSERDSLEKELQNFDETKDVKIQTLYDFKKLSHLAEALRRMNTITRMDAKGISVFDYENEDMTRKASFYLGMPMDNFNLQAKEELGDSYWKNEINKKEYSEDRRKELYDREESIRSFFDLGGVISELPQFRQYLDTKKLVDNVFQKSFIEKSKMIKDVISDFFIKNKRPWFGFKKEYYEYHTQLQDFMISLFLKMNYANKVWDIKVSTGRNITYDISNPKDRWVWNSFFPSSLMAQYQEALTNINALEGKNEYITDEEKIAGNYFLSKLFVNVTSQGTFLEIINWDEINRDEAEISDLSRSFRLLPEGMKKEFYVYQLSKDGLNYTKTSFIDILDNTIFEQYSGFLDTVESIVDQHDIDPNNPQEITGLLSDKMIKGDQIARTVDINLSETLKDVFNTDVHWLAKDNVLTRRQPEGGWVSESAIPEIFKTAVKRGNYYVYYLIKSSQIDANRLWQGLTRATFNGYNVFRSMLTEYPVLRRLSESNLKKFITGNQIEVRFSGKTKYAPQIIAIPSGHLGRIFSRTRTGSMVVAPIQEEALPLIDRYYNTKSKHKVLEIIASESKNEFYRELSKNLLRTLSISNLNDGGVILGTGTGENADINFVEAYENSPPVYGYFDSETNVIHINQDYIKSDTDFEQNFLHELVHNFTGWAFNEDISILEAGADPSYALALKFRNDITKIYTEAKEYAKENNIKDSEGNEHYGLKNPKEFLSEAISSTEFQHFLKTPSAVLQKKGLKIQKKNWVETLYDKLINALNSLLGIKRIKNSYSMLDQVIGLTNYFLQGTSGSKMIKSNGITKSEGTGKLEAFRKKWLFNDKGFTDPRVDNITLQKEAKKLGYDIARKEDWHGWHLTKDGRFFNPNKGAGFIKRNPKGRYDFRIGTKISQPVKTTKDILNEITPDGPFKSHSAYSEADLISTLTNRILGDGYKYVLPSGEIVDFRNEDRERTPMPPGKIRTKVRNDVIPALREYEDNYASSTIDWLNAGALIETAKDFFPSKKDTDRSRYPERVLEEFKHKIQYSPETEYVRYSSLTGEQQKDIPFSNIFEGYNPIVAIHSSSDQIGKSYSLFDVTSTYIGKKGAVGGNNLFQKYFATERAAANAGITLSNTEAGRRKFLLGLTAMYIKSKNPNITLKYAGVFGIHNNGVDDQYLFMNDDFKPTIEAIANIKDFVSTLPSDIINMISNDKSKAYDYDQPWIHMLRQQLADQQGAQVNFHGGISTWKNTHITNDLSTVDRYLNGEGSTQEFIEMIKNRQRELRRKVKHLEDLRNDAEWQLLANTLRQLTITPAFETMNKKDLDRIRSHYTPGSDIDHSILAWMLEKTYQAKNWVARKVDKWQKEELFPRLREYNKRYFKQNPELQNSKLKDYLSDMSGTKFNKMFKTQSYDEVSKTIKNNTIKDVEGNDVEVNYLEIHWNQNDPVTQQALKDPNNPLMHSDVEFGKWIADTLEEEMIWNLLHAHRHKKSDGSRIYDRDDAVEELNLKWTKGMIPAMSKSVNEMLLSLDPKQAKKGMKKFRDKLANDEFYYDEIGGKDGQRAQKQKEQLLMEDLPDYFMGQLGTDSKFGSTVRMRMMGITNDGITGPILTDKIHNDILNKNLELLMNYFKHASERKRHYDEELIPYINSGHAILASSNLSRLQGDQSNAIQYLKIFADATIMGRAKELGGTLAGFDMDAFTNIVTQITTFNALAWNLPVALNSAVMNFGQFLNVAIANDKGNNGLFGFKEMKKSIATWLDPKKRKEMLAIGKAYFVADMNEGDILNDPFRRITTKNIFNAKTFHIGNWFTDYHVRMMVAYAQMLKDGSIKAYTFKRNKDGTVFEAIYNENLDPRWQGKDGPKLKEGVKMHMVKQGLMLDVNDKMLRGYDLREQRMLKTISDREIIGGMDELSQTQLSRMNGFKMLMQFASYFPAKVSNMFGSTKKSNVMGKYGKPFKGKKGEWLTEWELMEQEGTLRTLGKVFALRDIKENGFRKWSTLSSLEKRNLTKLAMDVGSMAILYGIYAGLTGDWDEEKPGVQSIVPDSRLARVFQYAAIDYIGAIQFETAFSIPVIDHAERIATLVFSGQIDQLPAVLPLSGTIRSINEVIPDTE